MGNSEDFAKRVEVAFQLLARKRANSFPRPSELSDQLVKVYKESGNQDVVLLKPDTAAMFTTASIEIWMRAVHSFLISAALTHTSPIWASVAGYYSSHYSVRAYAHLLGRFQLFRIKRVASLEFDNLGKFSCTFQKKDGGSREHELYWKVVKAEGAFASSPLFTRNTRGADASDCGHREKANYHDHLSRFPEFDPLTERKLRDRLDRLSQIKLQTPQVPRISRFPDLDNVQLIAYHRLVHFRSAVDEVVGGKNRFWMANRNPQWATKWIDFQLPDRVGLASELGQYA